MRRLGDDAAHPEPGVAVELRDAGQLAEPAPRGVRDHGADRMAPGGPAGLPARRATAPAMRSASSASTPSATCTAVSERAPVVRVPVRQSTTVSTRASASARPRAVEQGAQPGRPRGAR